jgi:hypothetical protein
MHDAVVRDFCLLAELSPHPKRIRRQFRNISGDVGEFVSVPIRPAMLVSFAYILAVGIMVIFTEIESIDSPTAGVDNRKSHCLGKRVVATPDEQWIIRFGHDFGTKLDARRMILVFDPADVAHDLGVTTWF